MTRIAISVLVLSFPCGPSWAAPPLEPETFRVAVDLNANLSDGSDDQPADETLGATAVGDPAPASSPKSNPDWYPDPSPTRLIVGPTARSLERGKVYLDLNGFVGGPFLQVGITDRISIGAGTPVLIPGIRPGEAFIVTPKVQLFKGSNTAAAVGLIYGSDSHGRAAIAYGVVTRGSDDASVTVGLALPPVWGGEGGSRAPIVMLGGEKRVTRTVKLISENFLASQGGVVGGGVRFVGRHATFDVGVGVPLGSDLVIPMFRLARAF